MQTKHRFKLNIDSNTNHTLIHIQIKHRSKQNQAFIEMQIIHKKNEIANVITMQNIKTSINRIVKKSEFI